MVMIGTVSFDGFTNKRTWNSRSPDIAQFFQDHLSLSPRAFARAHLPARHARDGPVRLGLLLARHPGREERGRRLQRQGLAGEFVHTLVPIAAAYVGAHYFTLLLYQGQAMAYLASDPLG